MKLKESAFANALGAISALYYVACTALVLFAPNLYLSVANSWIHMVDLAKIVPTGVATINLGSALMGFVTFTLLGWVSGLVFAKLYNNLAK